MSERRIITGCAAVHPDQRGGQHVAMACPGVLVIDDDACIGVLSFDERSQFKNKARAEKMLDTLTRAALSPDDLSALEWLRTMALAIHRDRIAAGSDGFPDPARALAVLDRLMGATK